MEVNTGFTIPVGVIHAPGPWPTFEVQLPQDDGALLAWQLGSSLAGDDLATTKKETCTQGCCSTTDMITEALDFRNSTTPDFESKFKRDRIEIASGSWGALHRMWVAAGACSRARSKL